MLWVNAELASVSHLTTQQMLQILECYFGLPFVIMKQLIKAHQAFGKIPSHNEASWKIVHQTGNYHSKLIKSCKELSDSVGKAETILSWPYQDILEMSLPQSEQRNLNEKEADMKARFKTLEEVYKDLEETSSKWMIRNGDAKPSRSNAVPYTAVGVRNDGGQAETPEASGT